MLEYQLHRGGESQVFASLACLRCLEQCLRHSLHGAHLLTDVMGEGSGYRGPPGAEGSLRVVLHGLRDPALAQLVAAVSSDLSVLRDKLSVGHQAPPLCISRTELAGRLSPSSLL